MKPTDTPMSKISDTLSNPSLTNPHPPNLKKNPRESGPLGLGISLVKKNEFTLILSGALIVTLVIFFLFFRSSDPKTQAESDTAPPVTIAELEIRIQAIEAALEKLRTEGAASMESGAATSAALNPLQQSIYRIENTMAVKFDSLTERMGKLEQQGVQPEKKPDAPQPVAKAASRAEKPKPVITSEKKPVAKPAPVAKPPAKPATFHTVQKGETLWGIAQKYQTSVEALRKLNKMPADAELQFGAKIQVK